MIWKCQSDQSIGGYSSSIAHSNWSVHKFKCRTDRIFCTFCCLKSLQLPKAFYWMLVDPTKDWAFYLNYQPSFLDPARQLRSAICAPPSSFNSISKDKCTKQYTSETSLMHPRTRMILATIVGSGLNGPYITIQNQDHQDWLGYSWVTS